MINFVGRKLMIKNAMIRLKVLFIVILAFTSAFCLHAQPGSGLAVTDEDSGFVPQGYQLDWSDEFNGTELNTTDWKFEIHDAGWVNNELQRYVGKTFKGNKVVFVEDGHLTIRCQKVDGEIVSGRINARPQEGWRYGYFEARIKLPKGKGTWPAFWMMPVNVDWNTNPWPNCGEIDIMEEVGADANVVSSSIHCEAYNHTKGTQKTHAMNIGTAESEYHVYGLEWTADKMTFYVDGQVQLVFNKESDNHSVWPFHYAFYPILNLAWGGDWGGYKGVDESAMPCDMLVDYVRVYKKPTPATAKKIVAYVTSWSSIMPDPFVMTHINYAFGGVGNDYRSVFADNTSRLKQIVALKQKNPELKVLLSLGGWGRGNFSNMAKDENNRKAFVQACKRFCDDYGLDGIDIDWEFPGNNSSGEASPSNEKQNFTLMMRDLREALGSDLLLTMASGSDPGYYDFRSCIQYMDFVNVMTYDLSGPPNHHSALYRGGTVGNGYMVQDESIKKHLSAGIPQEKLIMGLAFYGNSGSGSQISLQEIENGIASGKWVDHWDDVAKVPYVTDAATGKFAYGYDNARSQTIKCQYIVDNDLAGGMYWEYANDDNMGTERNTVFDCLRGNATQKENLKLNDVDLTYTGSNTYSAIIDMVQGETYTATGSNEMVDEDWFYDPDFFVPTDDGYKFVPLSGKYRVSADFNNKCFSFIPLDYNELPMRYNKTGGTGCIWLIGAKSCYGKPVLPSGSDTDWDESRALPLAHVAPNIHQITLEVGKQIASSQINFKFFHQNGWGAGANDEFTATGAYKISTASDRFQIMSTSGNDGNVKLLSGKYLKKGDVYVFTVDTTDPANAILRVDNLTAGIDNAYILNNVYDGAVYNLAGQRIAASGKPEGRKGIFIVDGKKVIR